MAACTAGVIAAGFVAVRATSETTVDCTYGSDLYGFCPARHEDLGDWIAVRAAVPHVADNADDGQPVLPVLVE